LGKLTLEKKRKYATCHNIIKRHKGTVSKPVKFARTTVFGGGLKPLVGGSSPTPQPPASYGPEPEIEINEYSSGKKLVE